MKVAVLCEFSGVVRDAFMRLGHDAVSCDLLPTQSPGPHIQDDCRNRDWSWADIVIGHPPCTRLCNSGVRWLAERNLWAEMREAAAFFLWMWTLPVARIALENPIPHRHAGGFLGIRRLFSRGSSVTGKRKQRVSGYAGWIR